MRRLDMIIAFATLLALSIAIQPIVAVAEMPIWSADISSSGETVTTPILKSGYNYRIVVAPAIIYLGGPNYARADAEYYANNPPDGWIWPNGTRPDTHSFLQINGQDVEWGPFSNGQPGPPYGHNYEAFYVGQGTPITFRIYDWIDGNNTDNSCHLPVYIYESPPSPQVVGGYTVPLDRQTAFNPLSVDLALSIGSALFLVATKRKTRRTIG